MIDVGFCKCDSKLLKCCLFVNGYSNIINECIECWLCPYILELQMVGIDYVTSCCDFSLWKGGCVMNANSCVALIMYGYRVLLRCNFMVKELLGLFVSYMEHLSIPLLVCVMLFGQLSGDAKTCTCKDGDLLKDLSHISY